MIGLLAVSVVAGFLAAISPCILPVLPVVLAAGGYSTAFQGGKTIRKDLNSLTGVRQLARPLRRERGNTDELRSRPELHGHYRVAQHRE